MRDGTVGLVLAAGAGSRFGGGKLLAPIGGRPILQHVLDALALAGVGEVVVVLGRDAADVEAAIEWRTERRVVNPDPERGLSSSVAVGFEAIGSAADAVLVALGDQPLVSVEVIRALVAAPVDKRRPIRGACLRRRARTQPGPRPQRRVRPRRRGDRRPRTRAGARCASGSRRRGARSTARTPTSTRPPTTRAPSRPPGPPVSAPIATRSSGSARSPTAPTSTRRSTRFSVPIRPGPTTRSSTRFSA